MKDLHKELLEEKMKVYGNRNAVQFLQRSIDGHQVTKTEFANTALISPVDEFTFREKFKTNCVHVMSYAGGFHVQVLDDGYHLYEVFDNQESDEMHTRVKSKEIKDIISFIWRYEADKLFNRNK
jgi:hypothetical protein